MLSEAEEFEHGYHDIPRAEIRARMSPEKLAIELSKLGKDSPPYILLSHELNLRLAKEQSIATWRAAVAGGLFALLSAALGAWLTSTPEKTQECLCPRRIEPDGPKTKLHAPPSAAQLPAQPVIQSQQKPEGDHGKQ